MFKNIQLDDNLALRIVCGNNQHHVSEHVIEISDGSHIEMCIAIAVFCQV